MFFKIASTLHSLKKTKKNKKNNTFFSNIRALWNVAESCIPCTCSLHAQTYTQ